MPLSFSLTTFTTNLKNPLNLVRLNWIVNSNLQYSVDSLLSCSVVHSYRLHSQRQGLEPIRVDFRLGWGMLWTVGRSSHVQWKNKQPLMRTFPPQANSEWPIALLSQICVFGSFRQNGAWPPRVLGGQESYFKNWFNGKGKQHRSHVTFLFLLPVRTQAAASISNFQNSIKSVSSGQGQVIVFLLRGFPDVWIQFQSACVWFYFLLAY